MKRFLSLLTTFALVATLVPAAAIGGYTPTDRAGFTHDTSTYAAPVTAPTINAYTDASWADYTDERAFATVSGYDSGLTTRTESLEITADGPIGARAYLNNASATDATNVRLHLDGFSQNANDEWVSASFSGETDIAFRITWAEDDSTAGLESGITDTFTLVPSDADNRSLRLRFDDDSATRMWSRKIANNADTYVAEASYEDLFNGTGVLLGGGQNADADRFNGIFPGGDNITSNYPSNALPDNRIEFTTYLYAEFTEADLSLAKTLPREALGAGEAETVTLAYENLSGGFAATGIVITDDYDESRVTLAGFPDTCSDNGDVLTCAIAELAAGASASLTYTATATAAIRADEMGTATITADTYDGTTSNNSSTPEATTPAFSSATGISVERGEAADATVTVTGASDQTVVGDFSVTSSAADTSVFTVDALTYDSGTLTVPLTAAADAAEGTETFTVLFGGTALSGAEFTATVEPYPALTTPTEAVATLVPGGTSETVELTVEGMEAEDDGQLSISIASDVSGTVTAIDASANTITVELSADLNATEGTYTATLLYNSNAIGAFEVIVSGTALPEVATAPSDLSLELGAAQTVQIPLTNLADSVTIADFSVTGANNTSVGTLAFNESSDDSDATTNTIEFTVTAETATGQAATETLALVFGTGSIEITSFDATVESFPVLEAGASFATSEAASSVEITLSLTGIESDEDTADNFFLDPANTDFTANSFLLNPGDDGVATLVFTLNSAGANFVAGSYTPALFTTDAANANISLGTFSVDITGLPQLTAGQVVSAEEGASAAEITLGFDSLEDVHSAESFGLTSADGITATFANLDATANTLDASLTIPTTLTEGNYTLGLTYDGAALSESFTLTLTDRLPTLTSIAESVNLDPAATAVTATLNVDNIESTDTAAQFTLSVDSVPEGGNAADITTATVDTLNFTDDDDFTNDTLTISLAASGSATAGTYTLGLLYDGANIGSFNIGVDAVPVPTLSTAPAISVEIDGHTVEHVLSLGSLHSTHTQSDFGITTPTGVTAANLVYDFDAATLTYDLSADSASTAGEASLTLTYAGEDIESYPVTVDANVPPVLTADQVFDVAESTATLSAAIALTGVEDDDEVADFALADTDATGAGITLTLTDATTLTADFTDLDALAPASYSFTLSYTVSGGTATELGTIAVNVVGPDPVLTSGQVLNGAVGVTQVTGTLSFSGVLSNQSADDFTLTSVTNSSDEAVTDVTATFENLSDANQTLDVTLLGLENLPEDSYTVQIAYNGADLANTFSLVLDAPNAIATGSVIISEIAPFGTSAGADDVFIELMNTTGAAISVEGLSVVDTANGNAILATLPSGAEIAANGFALLSRFDVGDNTILIATPDYTSTALVFDTANFSLQLQDENQDAVDSVGDGNAPFYGSASASMGRILPASDGTVASSWFQSTTASANTSDASFASSPANSSSSFEEAFPEVVLEDGQEVGNEWYIADANPTGASVSASGGVIVLTGTGIQNAFRLRDTASSGDTDVAFANSTHPILSLEHSFAEYFRIRVTVETANGTRYLVYEPENLPPYVGADSVTQSIGTDAFANGWQTLRRNLADDVALESGNSLTSVSTILFYGNGSVDNVRLLAEEASRYDVSGTIIDTLSNPVENASVNFGNGNLAFTDAAGAYSLSVANGSYTLTPAKDGFTFVPTTISATVADAALPNQDFEATAESIATTVYEDAQDGSIDRWLNSGDGAGVVTNEEGNGGSRVITFSGATGANNGYADNKYTLHTENGSTWNNTAQFTADFSLKADDYFQLYFVVSTTEGQKYLWYSPVEGNAGTVSGKSAADAVVSGSCTVGDTSCPASSTYVHLGLGEDATNGIWQDFTRNTLATDLATGFPSATLLSVDSFIVRGNISVDNIQLR